MLEAVAPKNDVQRGLKTQALQLTIELLKMRWLLFEQSGSSISTPFLVVLVFWLTIIFLSFGLFARVTRLWWPHSLSARYPSLAALFLILELDRPFEGLVQISSAPFRDAVERLGK